MPRNIELEFSGNEYINRNGEKAKADFRHMDGKRAFLKSQAGNRLGSSVSGKPVRVYRESELGERLLARFWGSTAQKDAEAFAAEQNTIYSTRGFYTAVVR